MIVNSLTKMVYYKPIKVMIDGPGLPKVIIDMLKRHYDIPQSIITDQGLLFKSKFWSSLCYILGIKKKLFTAFYLLTDGKTERQNSTMKVYLRAFVN